MNEGEPVVLRDDRRLVYSEYAFWLAWALIFALAGAYDIAARHGSKSTGITIDHWNPGLLWGFFPLFIVFLSRLVFGDNPIAAARKAVREVARADANRNTVEKLNYSALSALTPTELFAYYAAHSRSLASSLHNRAGVFLFIGGTMAAVGIMLFYNLVDLDKLSEKIPHMTFADWIIISAPKFGLFLSVEVIAFFFLRLYRSAMDEFRHFEHIQRRREEMVVALKICQHSPDQSATEKLVHSSALFSSPFYTQRGRNKRDSRIT
ncbi:hypothetical protein E7V67_019835 [[Empedobacter] haloabium]|uniref:Uncharacterized protein n=1 Tax=[Empedobacter] haloabium TaxID=592317 RepID=A0ABZ1UGX1_9BURK